MGVAAFIATGLDFDVDGFLKRSPFKPASVFRKGDIPPKDNPTQQPRPDSGFVVVIQGNEQPAILPQVQAAYDFLGLHEQEICRARNMGADTMMLDFGVPHQAILQQSVFLQPPLIEEAGKLGLGIMFSVITWPQG